MFILGLQTEILETVYLVRQICEKIAPNVVKASKLVQIKLMT